MVNLKSITLSHSGNQQHHNGIRVKVVFDEEKIQREGEYDLAEMQTCVDQLFDEYDFHKEGNLYIGPGTKRDFTNAAVVCVACGKADWFLENVRVWRWYNGENEENLLEDDAYYKVGFRQ